MSSLRYHVSRMVHPKTILRNKGKVLNGLLGDGGDLLGDGGNLLGDGEHPGSSMQLFK